MPVPVRDAARRPGGVRVGRAGRQRRPALALAARPAPLTGTARRGRRGAGGVQPPAGDQGAGVQPGRTGGQQVECGIRAIGDHDQGAIRPGAPDGQQQRPRPRGQGLVPPPVRLVVARGGGAGRQAGEGPGACRPGNGHQPQQTQPAPPARLEAVVVAGAHRVALDPLGGDRGAAAALDGLVDAEDERALRDEGGDSLRTAASDGGPGWTSGRGCARAASAPTAGRAPAPSPARPR